jgi:SAM-dependent methyltransferase
MTQAGLLTAASTRSPECPVCGRGSVRIADAPGWGEWRRCTECTHEFADPLPTAEQVREMLSAAYDGAEIRSGMRDFADMVRRRELLISDPELAFWTPAYRDVIDWLKSRLERGSTVLEVGCGNGFFLHALRRAGMQPVGLDVAATAVELNRKDGFRVWHGPIESLPQGWVRPRAVVAFFMLHHLVRPADFLNALSARWPDALLAVAQYGPSNRDPVRSTPPRMLQRWNARSLQVALRRAGYRVAVRELPSTGLEVDALRPVRSLSKLFMRVPVVYRLASRLAIHVMPTVLARYRRESFVLLALAERSER